MEILLGILVTFLGQYVNKLAEERIREKTIRSNDIKFLIEERKKQLSNLPIKSFKPITALEILEPHVDYEEKKRLEDEIEDLYRKLKKWNSRR